MNCYIDKKVVTRISNYGYNEILTYIQLMRKADNIQSKKSILEDLLKDVKILSSLAIASIDTYEALNNINILGNNKVESLFITVYQYLLRMMSRATPFGTFASLSDAILETTSDQNNIGEKSLENYKEYVRCATEYLFCIYDDVIFNLERFKEIKIHINPNIRKVENGIVFYIIGENPNYVEGKYVYYECSTKMNVMLCRIMQSPVTVQDLLLELSDDSIEDIKKLLEDRLLLLEIYPENDIHWFEMVCDKLSNINKLYVQEKQLDKQLNLLNEVNRYFKLQDYIKLINLMKTNYKSNSYLVINSESLWSDDRVYLHNDILKDIKSFMTLLSKLRRIPNFTHYQIDNYKHKFLEKYGYNRSVLIEEMFDDSRGIGSPFEIETLSRNQMVELMDCRQKIVDIINSKLFKGLREIELDDDDLLNLNNVLSEKSMFISSYNMNIKIMTELQKHYFMIGSIATSFNKGGYSGRFSFLNSNADDTKLGMEYWANNKKLWNVRSIGIDFKNNVRINGIRREKELLLQDIYVRMNRENNFELVTKEGGRIQLSSCSMENVSLKADIIRFMEIISNNASNISNFLTLLNSHDLRYCPRIVYKNIILIPESWIVDIATDFNGKLPEVDNLYSLLLARNIPQNVALCQGDKITALNTSFDIDKIILISELKKSGKVILSESLVAKGSNIFDKTCTRATELVFSVNYQDNNISNERIQEISTTQRKEYFQGSAGWLYIKLYSNKGLENNNLFFVEKEMSQLDIQYFFIRYFDPKPHLRIRFYIDKNNKDIVFDIFKMLDTMMKNLWIDDFSINVYEREIERYYADSSAFDIEQIFIKDSKLVLEILKYKNLLPNLEYKALIFKVLVQVLENTNLDIDYQKLFFSDLLKVKEFKIKYDYLIRTLNSMEIDLSQNELVLKLSNNIKEYLLQKNLSNSDISLFFDSYIHMFFNRMFGNNDIEKEFRLYLFRYFKSKVNRRRNYEKGSE